MTGLGTIINTAAIIAGGTVGVLFKTPLTKRYRNPLTPLAE